MKMEWFKFILQCMLCTDVTVLYQCCVEDAVMNAICLLFTCGESPHVDNCFVCKIQEECLCPIIT